MTQAPRNRKAKRGTTGRARYALALLPLLLFGGFAIVAGKMLYDQDVNGLDISAIPSALIGTKAPTLSLPPLEGSNLPALTDAAIKGKLTLVNVFASWCIPCRQEHPLLQELAKDSRIRVVGINYKDKQDNALRFLGELGNPFAAIGVDPTERRRSTGVCMAFLKAIWSVGTGRSCSRRSDHSMRAASSVTSCRRLRPQPDNSEPNGSPAGNDLSDGPSAATPRPPAPPDHDRHVFAA